MTICRLKNKALLFACIDRMLDHVAITASLVNQHNHLLVIGTCLLGQIVKYVLLEANQVGQKLSVLYDFAFHHAETAPDSQFAQEIFENALVHAGRLRAKEDEYLRQYATVPPTQRPSMNSTVARSVMKDLFTDHFAIAEGDETGMEETDDDAADDADEDADDEEEDEEEEEGDESEENSDEQDSNEGDITCACQHCQGVLRYKNADALPPIESLPPLLAIFIRCCNALFVE